jgi:FtsH-binding integral membrane protein
MSYADNPYRSPSSVFAAQAAADDRADFITKTYLHLAGAIGACVILTAIILKTPMAEGFVGLLAQSRFGWLIVLGVFMVVSTIAEKWARSATSVGTQYMGLGLYVVVWSVMFTPLLLLASRIDSGIIPSAASATLGLFSVLTAVVFITRKDFSFLRGVLMYGGILALVGIVSAVIFGFELGTWFSVAMVGLAGAAILYDTSNILKNYPEDRYVGAALQLFASVAMMFWYLLRIFMSRD